MEILKTELVVQLEDKTQVGEHA